MATPKRQAIIERAKELWHVDRAKSGDPSFDIEPTEAELRESGWLSVAQSELMRDRYRAEFENNGYVSENSVDQADNQGTEPFSLDVSEAMKTGTFTSGSSGSGKTVLNFWIAHFLMKEGIQVYVIDPSQQWYRSSVPIRMEVPERKYFEWKDGSAQYSTVFDVSRLTYPQRINFANKLSKILLDQRKKSQIDPRAFVIFEEGQLYVPEGSMRPSRKHNVCNDVIELITNGRNYNLRFGIITQFPSEVDKLLVKIVRQRYFGFSSEANDIRYIKQIIGEKWAEKLKMLDVGQFVYSYPKRGNETKIVDVPQFQIVQANSTMVAK